MFGVYWERYQSKDWWLSQRREVQRMRKGIAKQDVQNNQRAKAHEMRDCEVVSCQDCRKELPGKKFDELTKMNYFSQRQTAVCNVCTSKEHDLLQKLQGSNKKRCNCPGAMNNIHEDKCFMSWHGVGPRPFYGSDVLKRNEAEWLEKKNQLKKRRQK